MGIKHLLLFITIVIFIGVFYRVIRSRLYHLTVEGLEGKNNQECNNKYEQQDTLPLKEYIIKACYNSAYDPNETQTVSVKNLEMRIAEGYRFVDLNVFSSEGKLYVGYSPSNNPTLVDVSIPFTEAIDCIKKNAFTKSTLKVKEDATPLLEPPVNANVVIGASIRDNYVNYPMFVFLRVYRSPTSKLDIVAKIAEMLQSTVDAMYYRTSEAGVEKAIEIDGCTPLNHIKRKILFCMDITNILQIYAPPDKPSADQVPLETRKALSKFVNAYSGGNVWRHGNPAKSMPLLISDMKQPYKTNLFHWQILFPSVGETVNPDTYQLILENSIQTIVVRPYLSDTNLTAYVKIFKDAKRPMVCGVHAYTNIKRLRG